MSLRKSLATLLLSIFMIGAAASSQQVFAQTADDSQSAAKSERVDKEDETNLDTQLYLLVATNQDIDDTKLPAALEQVVKQLRPSLPFKNYRLAATLINRVKNNGRLNLKWVGGPLGVSNAPSVNPSFNEFKIVTVRLLTDVAGQSVVRMEGFNFGARIPIQTGMVASTGPPPAPIINYEATGLSTDISMREGEPVVVGTLNVGPSGDAIILVMSAKRSNK
jgi:hypothetical protein